MKALILIAALVSFEALAVSVPKPTTNQAVCYGREYSAKHMKSNPLQTVKKMEIKFFKEAGYEDTLLMELKVDVKKEAGFHDLGDGRKEYYVNTKPYGNTFSCYVNDGQFHCGIDCDGGSVGFEGTFGSTVKLVNKGFVVEGGCGEEAETLYLEAVKGGDDIFNLVALPKEYCQK